MTEQEANKNVTLKDLGFDWNCVRNADQMLRVIRKEPPEAVKVWYEGDGVYVFEVDGSEMERVTGIPEAMQGPDYIELTWRQRLFSWPWRPWIARRKSGWLLLQEELDAIEAERDSLCGITEVMR
jgi:hypothetical protein